MPDAKTFTMQLGKRDFAFVVVAAVVERQAQGYALLHVVKQRGAVHPAADYNHRIFHLRKHFLQSAKLAKIHETAIRRT